MHSQVERPLSYWEGVCFAGSDSKVAAHDVNLIHAVHEIEVDSWRARDFLHRWKEGKQLPTWSADYRFDALLTRYPVDPEHWWNRETYPPRYVLVCGLDWRGALLRLIAPKLGYLCELIGGAANVIAAWEESIEGPHRPSEMEYGDALLHLLDVAEEVSFMTRDIATDVLRELAPTDDESGADESGRSTIDPAQPTVAELLMQPLSLRARDILQAMVELKAASQHELKPAQVIAVKALGGRACANGIKDVMSDLVRRGWIKSREGRGGGAWFTDEGLTAARRLPDA